MKPRRRAKGGVERTSVGLETSAANYLTALERRDKLYQHLGPDLAALAELQEALDAAEHECALHAQRHLTGTKNSLVKAGVKLTRSKKSSRVVSAEKLLGKFPNLHLVNGLFKVMLGPFDRVAASGAYDADTIAWAVKIETSFKYHVEKHQE